MDRIRLGERDLVCFLHIPRTGGTSFFEVLARHFEPHEVRRGGDRRKPARDPGCRLVSGPAAAVTVLRDRVPHLVTILREPVARTMSHYRMVRRMPRHPLHGLAARSTFLEFLQHADGGRADADRQTRQLAGPVEGASRGALLEAARERLESIACFGLRERFDESIRLLERTFGWEPTSSLPHVNGSGDTNHRLALDARELAAAEELNRLDLELYRFARRLWRERAAEPASAALTA